MKLKKSLNHIDVAGVQCDEEQRPELLANITLSGGNTKVRRKQIKREIKRAVEGFFPSSLGVKPEREREKVGQYLFEHR